MENVHNESVKLRQQEMLNMTKMTKDQLKLKLLQRIGDSKNENEHEHDLLQVLLKDCWYCCYTHTRSYCCHCHCPSWQ